MIDRKSRNKVAEVLRHLISGKITNFDFEGAIPSSDDPAISAIEDSAWCFYDDFREHKLKDEWALPEKTRKTVVRWILFLHTSEEYQWPEFRFAGVRPLRHGWFSRLLGKPEKERTFMQSGTHSVWPFFNGESYDSALRNPRLLSAPGDARTETDLRHADAHPAAVTSTASNVHRL